MPDIDPLTTIAGCFLYVDDADALHDEWASVGIEREFAVIDPSGNVVRVGSRSTT